MDSQNVRVFLFEFNSVYFINEMNPVILLSIICNWYLKIPSLPKLCFQ